ncbi:type III restriction enzyme [Vibrio crassostreae]|uniref:type III restriction-modification system endonuclease n=1 Tax=Vibrio crassostreae TaxID=246167 RepID=UPI000F46B4A0|nr:DEAD/DEAH box helicase family protein [Vibrio crassostreae]ROO50009.1 type III restriction enzyme [Vibrio crassostreae]CAK1755208.1 type III restriction enzyme [Vibrio crassostreae]CAK1774900.1 type III restriction enzyme [Vibrio crassostreae]CAK2644830.1 type III restriction enzyme [Vibrio crassostreae]CAK3137987.1 type III restriction enzyme [Vibrio crassostreae]
MKLKFKHQKYQADSVQAIVDCFKGQLPNDAASRYRMDPGVEKADHTGARQQKQGFDENAFKNAEIQLNEQQLLANVQQVQRHQNIPQSIGLLDFKDVDGKSVKYSSGAHLNLDVEMETGTGKTYCFLKSIFELNKQYGWTKFIIVVPSIAIREGVYKSLEITAEHFLEDYGKRIRPFVYNSKQLHEIESFSSDGGINVMVINVQAFNARGKDARRIYEELDDFQSRRPIDVIKANRPVMIMDEPQKMEGKKTLESLAEFTPLFILRYSATHRVERNKVFRLDAVDAYNQKLVKKIGVRGITTKGLSGTNAYLYLENIEISPKKPPVARVEFEVRNNSGIKRVVRKLGKGDNLYDLSDNLEQYKNNFVVSDINAVTDTVSFLNGVELTVGDAIGDVSEIALRRMQIREAIKAHLDKEVRLFDKGIKVLSLFFIDEVAKYRDYEQPDEKGEYARIFEEEYQLLVKDYIPLDSKGDHADTAYARYLKRDSASGIHQGYFSIDKKKRLVDPKINRSGDNKGLSDDVDAYDLILKDKERLLNLSEPTRFIFSHSALREGWDNPNVFVICTLKHSDNTISRHQEVGRGLRLAVNQEGERVDHPAIVHDINHLTVVASESYKDFVRGLQQDISNSLSSRPSQADEKYFTGKVLNTPEGDIEVTPEMAKHIYRYLLKNDYSDDNDRISNAYHDAKRDDQLATLPESLKPYAEQVFHLIDSVYSDSQLPDIADDRKAKRNELNNNFDKKEFQELWARINHKAIYNVDFESDELVSKAIHVLDSKLRVQKLHFDIIRGEQVANVDAEQMKAGQSFKVEETESTEYHASVKSNVRYDLLGKVADLTKLKRATVADILRGIGSHVFDQFKNNPEDFIAKAAQLINEQKATMVIEHLAYDTLEENFEANIFDANGSEDFSYAGEKLKRHIYDYVITDSKVERQFVEELDTRTEVSVYAKLPKGFFIPTPLGSYNPDWAIAFQEGAVKHVYFIAETKGSMQSLQLKGAELAKIECAKKFFETVNEKFSENKVRYDVVDSYESLKTLIH